MGDVVTVKGCHGGYRPTIVAFQGRYTALVRVPELASVAGCGGSLFRVADLERYRKPGERRAEAVRAR